MPDINVVFLGEQYSFPADLHEYLDILSLTESVQESLHRALDQQVEASSSGLIGTEDMHEAPTEQASIFVGKLCEKGIFSKTIAEYAFSGEGYKLFDQANEAHLEARRQMFIQKIDTFMEDMETAERNAAANITGTGVRVISGSFATLAAHAAYEYSVLEKQAKTAEAQYSEEIARMRRARESAAQKREADYLYSTYLPNAYHALSILAFGMMDRYISDLMEAGLFNQEALKYVDIRRSVNLLQNLKLSPDKKAVLKNAFVACPYNVQVYLEAVELGLLDYDSFQAAVTFEKGDAILSFLEKNWGEVSFPTKFNINYPYIKLLALLSGKAPTDLLRARTEQYALGVVKAYSEIADMLASKELCYKVIGNSEEDAILAGDTLSKNTAHSYVDAIVTPAIWSQLTEKCGHPDLLDRIKVQVPEAESAATKRDVDLLLKEKLHPVLEEARQIRENEIIKKHEDEAQQKASAAEKAKRTAKRNKKIKILCLAAIAIAIIIAIASSIISNKNNAKSYQNMAGEFCVYRVINDDGEERDEFNWWLSIGKDGTMQMSSWSYAFDDTAVNSYSGELKNKADFRKFEAYRIEDYCADVSEYEEALYCYEFHIADEWDDFDGYIVCWQYHNGKIVDVYCDDYRYSFVETSDDYNFNKWEDEINSDELSKNVQKLIDNIDVSEEDAIEEIETLLRGIGGFALQITLNMPDL